MAILRWERFAVLLAASLFFVTTFSTDLFASPAGVTLGTTFVPKEKMFLFICIGNSEMTGRETKVNLSTVPNAWSYRIPNPPVLLDRKQGNADIASTLYKWALAQSPLHIDRNDNFNKQDPTTPFIQSLAKRNAGNYFGVMQLSGSEYLISTFQRGKYRYDTIMNNVLKMKPNVTIAAIVSMFNTVEVQDPYPATEITPYLTNTQTMVSQIREDLGMPNLPYIHSGYPVLAKGVYDPTLAAPKQIIPIIKQIPGSIAHSTLIPTDGLTIFQDSYLSHYDSLGCFNWGSRVADTVMAWGLVPINSQRAAAGRQLQTARATDAVYITNGKIPAALSIGTAGVFLYTLDGKFVGNGMFIRRQAHEGLKPGVYIVKRNLR